jgi:hypothetical protein
MASYSFDRAGVLQVKRFTWAETHHGAEDFLEIVFILFQPWLDGWRRSCLVF